MIRLARDPMDEAVEVLASPMPIELITTTDHPEWIALACQVLRGLPEDGREVSPSLSGP